MKTQETKYTIAVNKSAKTYTIRRYDNGKLTAKYRTYRQAEISDFWTENDINNYLRYNSGDYYRIK